MKDLKFNDEQIKTIFLKKAKEIRFNEMLKFTFETIMSFQIERDLLYKLFDTLPLSK